MLLEKRVLFFGHQVERLSSYQYSLVSLMPELLRSLQDVGAPRLNSYQNMASSSSSAAPQSGDNLVKSRIRKFGLPLRLFGEGSFFQPYIPLQQMDVLMSPSTTSFMVGTSNAIFTQHRGCNIDVIANVDTGTLEIKNPALASILSLTSADKRFIDEISKSVVSTWSQEDDPSLNQQIGFTGSDEDIRSRFEQYICSMLTSVKAAMAPPEVPTSPDSPPAKAKDYLTDFNHAFIKAWQQTKSCHVWEANTTSEILVLGISPGHPKEVPSTMALFQSSMSAKLQELGKNMAPMQQNLNKAMESASNKTGESTKTLHTSASQMFSAMSGWYSERKREWSSTSKAVEKAESDGDKGIDEMEKPKREEEKRSLANDCIEVTKSFEDITLGHL